MNKFLSAILLLYGTILLAQERCGYSAAIAQRELRQPGYKQAVEATFNQAKEHANYTSRSGNIHIGIVFHVLYKTAAQNLDDSVLLDQLTVLNEDYSHTNADASNVRPVFDSVAADTKIRFYIKGIVRVPTSQTFTSILGLPEDSLVKNTSAGGSDAFDPAHYLNVWICPIEASLFGAVLGFAYPPANLPNWPSGQEASDLKYEGVVVDYRVVGRNNPTPYPNTTGGGGNLVIRGRTLTHEIGHYLGLRHIWGDGGLFGGPNNCQQSDGIDDTPFANSQSNFNCNKSKNTCSGIDAYYGFNVPDMIENYMDYSEETCMNLFTRGQGAFMYSVIQIARPGILQTIGMQETMRLQATLAPNPTTGMLHIFTEEKNIHVVVRNTIGATVHTSENLYSIDLSEQAKGIYFVEIMSGTKLRIEKIILQ